MAQQTFTLDEEMSVMVELCDRLRVNHKIEICSQGSGYEKMFFVSDPTSPPNWICAPSLKTLVDIISARKLAQKK